MKPQMTGSVMTFGQEMDRFLDQFWESDEYLAEGSSKLEIDVVDTQEALTLEAELPGIEPKDFQLTKVTAEFQNGVLTVVLPRRRD